MMGGEIKPNGNQSMIASSQGYLDKTELLNRLREMTEEIRPELENIQERIWVLWDGTSRLLKTEYVNILFPHSETVNNNTEMDALTGSHKVIPCHNLYFKFGKSTEDDFFPAHALSVHVIDQLFQLNVTPACLFIALKKGEDIYPVIVSCGVKGEILEKQVQPENWTHLKFDNRFFSGVFALGLLTGQEDWKFDNFIVEETLDLFLRIYAIDTDLCFQEDLVKDSKGHFHMAGIRIPLFFFKQAMGEFIHDDVRNAFKDPPELVVMQWLEKLYRENKYYAAYVEQGLLEAKTLDAVGLFPVRLHAETVSQVLRRLQALQKILSKPGPLKLRDIFYAWSPILARYYDVLMHYHKEAPIPYVEGWSSLYCARADLHNLEEIETLEDLRLKEELKKILSLDQVIEGETVKEQLEKVRWRNHDFKKQCTTSIDDVIKNYISGLNFSAFKKSIQVKIFSYLNNCDSLRTNSEEKINRLRIQNVDGLTDDILVKLPSVEILELEGCTKLTSEGLKIYCSQKNEKNNKTKIILKECPPIRPRDWKLLADKCHLVISMETHQKTFVEVELDEKNPDIIFQAIQQGVTDESLEKILIWNPKALEKYSQEQVEKFLSQSNRQSKEKSLIATAIRWLDERKFENLAEIKNPVWQRMAQFLDLYLRTKGHPYFRDKARQRWQTQLQHVCMSKIPSTANKLEVKISGGSFGKTPQFLAQAIVDQCFDPYTGQLKPSQLSGIRPVYAVSIDNKLFYFKFYPEFPGIEYAVDRLFDCVMGSGTPHGELVKITVGKEVYPVWISEGIDGMPCHHFDPETREKLNPKPIYQLEDLEKIEIDEKTFTQLILMTLLICPEDAKPDNWIIYISKDKKGKPVFKLVSIDNDHAFVSVEGKEETATGYRIKLRVKSFLLCLKAMQKPLHPEVVEEFLSFDTDELLTHWLQDVEQHDTAMQALFQNELTQLSERKDCKSIIPTYLSAQGVKRIYTNMERIKGILQYNKQHKKSITHAELVTTVEPLLARYYQAPLQEEVKNPVARFRNITHKEYRVSKEGASQSTLSTLKTLEAMLDDMPSVQASAYYSLDVAQCNATTQQKFIQKWEEGRCKSQMVHFLLLWDEVRRVWYFRGYNNKGKPINDLKEVKGLTEALSAPSPEFLDNAKRFKLMHLIRQGLGYPKSYTPKEANDLVKILHYQREEIQKAREQLLQKNDDLFQKLLLDNFREQVINGIDFETCNADVQTYIFESIKTSQSQFHTLIFKNATALTPQMLVDIVIQSSGLHTLDLSGCTQLNSTIFNVLGNGEQCRGLQILNVSGLKELKQINVQRGVVLGFANPFPQLKRLIINDCENLNSLQIDAPELTYLQSKQNQKLKTLTIHAPHLKWANFMGCKQLTEMVLAKGLKICEELYRLKLENCEVIPESHRVYLERYTFLLPLILDEYQVLWLEDIAKALEEKFKTREERMVSMSRDTQKLGKEQLNRWLTLQKKIIEEMLNVLQSWFVEDSKKIIVIESFANLGQRLPEKALELLLKRAAGNEGPDVRTAALRTLGRWTYRTREQLPKKVLERVLETFLKAAEDKNYSVRGTVLWALWGLGFKTEEVGEQLTEKVLKFIKKSFENGQHFFGAALLTKLAVGVAKMGEELPAHVLELLLETTRNSKPEKQKEAWQSISQILLHEEVFPKWLAYQIKEKLLQDQHFQMNFSALQTQGFFRGSFMNKPANLMEQYFLSEGIHRHV